MSANPITIRRVSVEFLRPGPSHNQLLSPYTHYLAVCNDAGAAVVTVPYEQRVFERRLKDLRYETGDERDRQDMLHEVGRDMGRILEAVPGFTGAVTSDLTSTTVLVHLRLTLSAAELALLPFELAEVPVGSTACAVSIQARPPVVVTRHIRTVTFDGVTWPDRPRILFVAADRDGVPFAEHKAALKEAIEPFRYPTKASGTTGSAKVGDHDAPPPGGIERFGDLLTIMVSPTLVELQRECEVERYTHIHVLTHGDLAAFSSELYGIVLRGENGEPDVVSGERFVSAITRPGHRPAVVTIASCDSGNVGSVVTPGASFAHAIHQAGIPLVVGSQFPLSKEGSVPLTARLYRGLLWGEHPLLVLQQARAELHARFNTYWHDWASVVVYESLPPTLDQQVELLRYSQARRALNAALENVDLAVASKSDASYESILRLRKGVAAAVDRLPRDGEFAVECMGLRASSHKRLAQAAFTLSGHTRSERGDPIEDQLDLLDQARIEYAQAVRGLLVNDARAVQRKATLHWVLVQLVSLSEVLGHAPQRGEWEAARLASEHYFDHPDHEERAWAHASLSELWLLRLAEGDLSEKQVDDLSERARSHAEKLNEAYPGLDAFPVKSTRRQFERYATWWGSKKFDDAMSAEATKRRASWARKNGLVETALRLGDILARSRASGTRDDGGGARLPPEPEDPEPPYGPRLTSAARPTEGAAPTLGATRADGASALPSDGMKFTIDALPAGHGDCLWIEYGDPRTPNRILIDCGTQGSSPALLKRIDGLPRHDRIFELFVLSHIDADHIGGALPVFGAIRRDLRFSDVWFNGWRHVSGQLGARQAEMFSTAIVDLQLPWNLWRDGDAIVTAVTDLPERILPGGMRLTLLSPTPASLSKLGPVWKRELKRQGLEPGGRVDYSRFLKGTPSTIADAAALKDIDNLADAKFAGDSSAPNGSSIALLAEFGGASVLLAGDAHAPILVESIRSLLRQRGAQRLKLDLFKVSHHGSHNNLSRELLDLLDCPRYLISTNGDHFYHPDRQAVARILRYGGDRKDLYFNYCNRFNEVWGSDALASVRETFACTTFYPPGNQPGIRIALI